MRYEIPGGSDRISSEYTELLARLDRLTALLDSQFRIPWTPIRFGWDAIVGLVPVLGDLAMMIASLYLVTLARRLGAGKAMTALMIGNVLVDTLIGAVPMIGTVFDIWFRANERNLRLLVDEIERGYRSGERVVRAASQSRLGKNAPREGFQTLPKALRDVTRRQGPNGALL